MLLSFYLSMKNPLAAIICYLVAFAGDAVDGYVARAFNQSIIFSTKRLF